MLQPSAHARSNSTVGDVYADKPERTGERPVGKGEP